MQDYSKTNERIDLKLNIIFKKITFFINIKLFKKDRQKMFMPFLPIFSEKIASFF